MSIETPPRHPAGHLFGLAGMALSTLVVCGILLGISFYAGTFPTSSQLSAVISATLVDLANEDREAQDLGALTINPVLVAAAQAKANDMAENGYFSHESPEGITPWHWFREVGYDYAYAGENLAVNFSDSINVERAWMDSPEHRANILNGRYTEIGIATAVGTYNGKRTTFVVQMFGTPKAVASAKPAASAPVVVNAPESPTPTEPVPEEETIAVEPQETTILGAEVVAPPSYSTPVERLIVSPETLLHLLYIVCALIVVGSLALVTGMEFKRHHTRHVLAACVLLVVIGGCLVVADQMVFGPLTIG